MPNLVNRLVVKELQNELGKADGMVIVSFGGVTVKESEAMRNQLAAKGAGLTLVRNSLARVVLAERGFEVGDDMLVGNTAIAFGNSESAIHASKIFQGADVKKAGKVKIRGAVLEGKLLGAKDAVSLADVPDKKTLQGKLVGLIVSGPRNLAMLLNAVPAGQARLLKARSDQLESAGGTPAA